jgi:ATP-dependent Clp protease ATP-binding subunit ClpA
MTELTITNHLQFNLNNAKKLALEFGRNGVSPELILYSILDNPSLGCLSIFEQSNFDFSGLAKEIEKEINNKKPTKNPSDHFTSETKQILFFAEDLAKNSFKIDFISAEVLFLCFFDDEFLTKSFKNFFGKKTAKEINELETIKKLFESSTIYLKDFDFPQEQVEVNLNDYSAEGNLSENYLDMFSENKVLSEFAENLNLKAAKGHFENIVDFDGKIDELTSILCRKKKPNAILVGPAGSGKTACIQSLALNIVRGEAPELLANKVIYSVNLSGMVAGTMYRGQFEERLKNFVNEAKKYNNIILFIDEIHTLIGAGGGSSSSLEASNILKPELARGTISCIGATTINEYTDTIKKDSALDRRFERVIVREPSKFIMKQILPEIISHYEDFHGVKYSEEFIENVVDYCEKFLPNRFYPDKAVTVIDHCGAQAKVNFWKTDESVKESQKKILHKLENFGEVPSSLFEELNKKLEQWKEKVLQEEPTVELEHLTDFFEKRLNPLASFDTCSLIIDYVKKEFVGQKKIINDFFQTLIKTSMGLGKKNTLSSPDSYLFYGDKSTGKTLFSKILQDALEKNGASVVYYSGIQLSDSYSQYKIISDFSKNTTLCEKIIMNPNSVIIIDDFDEINFSCIDLFCQILKEGKLQMSNGDIADFSNCKFIFTCSKQKSSSMGFVSENENGVPNLNKKLQETLQKSFCLLAPSKRDLRRIVYNKLKQIKLNLRFKNIQFNYDFKFIKDFVNKNSCSTDCVKVINKAIEEDLIEKISKKVLNGEKDVDIHFLS